MVPYSIEEINQILQIRSDIEGIKLDQESLSLLAQIGHDTSLRHAIQLLSPSSILAGVYGKQMIDVQVLQEIKELYIDAKQSSLLLSQGDNSYYGFSLSN